MTSITVQSIEACFSDLEDPRVIGRCSHSLNDILIIALCAMLCGAEDWDSIAQFGHAKASFFKRFLGLPNGIPSADTFARVFSMLSPRQFESCFRRWVEGLINTERHKLIAIDGKTVRRSHDRRRGQPPIHIVNAFAGDTNLVLGHLKTEEKSNEITAIPELLERLLLRGCIVTIDAIGCQKAIAEQIIEQEGDYVLALKGNQGRLAQAVETFFDKADQEGFQNTAWDYYEHGEKGHGREETRRLWCSDQLASIEEAEQWKGLHSVIMVESYRKVDEKETLEYRYYISSCEADAKLLFDAVRHHWRIENSLHWVLDMAFREDESRVRHAVAAENLSLLRKMALNILRQDKSTKLGIKNKRLKAGWDEPYLLNLLNSWDV